MEFLTSLVKTSETNQFLIDNCTHVTGEYWIFEGDNELLKDELQKYEIVAGGVVPCLGDMTEAELIAGCKRWYWIKI